jgi:hypothetical protein
MAIATKMRIGAALAFVLVALPARADSSRTYSVGATVGYASELESIADNTVSKYRVGVGIRAGVSIPKLYLGVAFAHHFGTTESARGVGSSYDANYTSTLLGPEIGYDAAFGDLFMLRPYIGGGVLFERARTKVLDTEKNDDHYRWHITPGLLWTANVGALMLGVDFRVVVSPIVEPVKWAPGAFGTIGARF